MRVRRKTKGSDSSVTKYSSILSFPVSITIAWVSPSTLMIQFWKKKTNTNNKRRSFKRGKSKVNNLKFYLSIIFRKDEFNGSIALPWKVLVQNFFIFHQYLDRSSKEERMSRITIFLMYNSSLQKLFLWFQLVCIQVSANYQNPSSLINMNTSQTSKTKIISVGKITQDEISPIRSRD